MTKPIVAVAGIAIAAVAAAGVGSYLAVRHAIGLAPTSTATEPAVALAEPPPVAETPPAGNAAAETMVEVDPAAVEPAAAAPPEEPRRAPRRASISPAPRPAPPAPRPAAAAASTASRAPAARPTAPDPRPRSHPTAPPATRAEPAPAPEPEPAPRPEPARNATPAPNRGAGDRAGVAGDPPPGPTGDLPVVEGWVRADGSAPATGPGRDLEPAAPPRVEPRRPPLAGTSLLAPRSADPVVAADPWPSFDELEVAADSVIGIQLDSAVSTQNARLEDTVEARVIRDVQVGDQVAVPSGARMRGSVVLVETGGRLRSASRLGVRFHTLLMDDGAEVRLSTETIYREGKSPGGDSVAKIGGAAVAGSILGAIFGGERGAAIGGSIGAAGGTAAALNGEADPAVLPAGSRLTVRLSRPAFVMAPR